MNASKNTSTLYAKWFDQRVKAIVDQERIPWQPEENYLQWNAAFVTLVFDKRRIARRQSALNDGEGPNANLRELSPEFWNVDWLYKRMCRAILGRDFHKQRDRQPLMIACADVNGTRYGTPDRVENLHVHSLWVFRKNQINAFRQALKKIEDDPRMDLNDIDAIDVQDVDSMQLEGDRGSHLSAYMAKFTVQNATRLLVGYDLAIYPLEKALGRKPPQPASSK